MKETKYSICNLLQKKTYKSNQHLDPQIVIQIKSEKIHSEFLSLAENFLNMYLCEKKKERTEGESTRKQTWLSVKTAESTWCYSLFYSFFIF